MNSAQRSAASWSFSAGRLSCGADNVAAVQFGRAYRVSTLSLQCLVCCYCADFSWRNEL